MKKNYIKCGDCLELMKELPDKSVDVVFTSPFYATNKKAGKSRNLKNTKVKAGQYDYVRYDVFVDNMNREQYCDFTVKLFNSFDRVLNKNGCICYNISYGEDGADTMLLAITSIINKTNFSVADIICWKKNTAMPNVCSPNKLTRICEYIFVFCRKSEFRTFNSNKELGSKRKTGQQMYSSVYNFVEARNNDGSCPLNKATFSSELAEKVLRVYAPLSWGGVIV